MQRRFNTSHFARSLSPGLLALAMLAAVIGAYFFGVRVSLTIPTYHLDGAFQTASGLYRLAAGEYPGRDFFPYLGVGPLYFLYPVFLLEGGHIAASVMASHLMTLVAQAGAIFVLAWLLVPFRKFQISMALAIVWMVVAVSVSHLHNERAMEVLAVSPASSIQSFDAFLTYLGNVTETLVVSPGNSLRPIRGFLPYLSAMLAYLVVRFSPSRRLRFAGLGIVCGLCLTWSNDFGLPTFGLLLCWSIGLAVQRGEFNARNMSILIGSAVAAICIALTLATAGHVLPLLRYNFLDVARDQWWYFGSWRESRRIFSVLDVQKLFQRWDGALLFAALLVFAGIVAVVVRRPSLEKSLLLYIGAALFAGGFLASVGGHLDFGYFVAFLLWCTTTVTIASVVSILKLVRARLSPVLRAQFVAVGSVSLAAVCLCWTFAEAGAARDARTQAANDKDRFYVAELGGYLGVAWQSYIAEARRQSQLPVMEEYWGLWSAIRREPAKIPVDSVIHALGETRDRVQDFVAQLPPLVVSTRHSLNPEWQPWSFGANWWFYRIVLENYVPVMLSPSTVLWEKHAAQNWPPVACAVSAVDTIRIEAAQDGLYDISVNYRIEGSPNRSLLMVRNNINMARGAEGYLSLNPRATAAVFPASIRSSGAADLDFRIQSASLAKVRIDACAARKVTLAPSPLLVEVTGEQELPR